MSVKPERTISGFKKGLNCSQAVMSVYSEQFGLSRRTVLKIARGFGGGTGRTAQTCGAIAGPFMALGLKFGNADANDKEAKEGMCGIVRENA